MDGDQAFVADYYGRRETPSSPHDLDECDEWLIRNVRVCSRQEYLRYRDYLICRGHPAK
ncbi:hypothetical protein [Castellaniella sp. GW247-6E4]|uniref:hypothetical protein n=1 Tax=Castellaniella sp. GW247-6E4 TaxID=3140380 RepID=UPI00331604FC